ncbi:hypothetical protein C440_01585 [Haloferax mucosum ATCC BAA-1512]|uniref:Uncharacterized protein n=1 Tax=Haloferax mucosum ATCC BAA-1512 TaxID=662479 RepID=M0ISM7_9EURY|nr:hypothetical protein [Haloferax mucosum]ELZ99007.1 hypothetical protein C440_01585 [Haloferax mucosum ATCC BAA-1512]
MKHTDTRAKPTMRDVSHTPPAGESVTNVWERGNESEASGE